MWLTGQNSQLLEIQDRINLTLVIKKHNHYIRIKMRLNLEIEYMLNDMDFYLLLKTWVHT